jgi:hypothetical protein
LARTYIEAKDALGATALHYAANHGHVEAIKLLVAFGVDKDAKDVNGATALHYAANHGQMEAIKVMVQLGVDFLAKSADGTTALHQAAISGHMEAIKLLAQLGVDKDAKAANGATYGVAPGDNQRARGGDQVVGGAGSEVRCKGSHRRDSSPALHPTRSPSGGAAVEGARTHRTRTQKAAATSERAHQAAEQDTAQAREAAERMGAQLIEEEEREEAQRKVRGAPPLSPTFG